MTDDMPNLDLSTVQGTEETKNLAAIMYAKGRRDLAHEMMKRVKGLGKVHPLVALRAAHLYFCAHAEEKWYGSFQGGDPRLFHPDPECSTEKDRANHQAACEAWEKGERTEFGPSPLNEEDITYVQKDGEERTIPAGTAFVQSQVFGLGTVTQVDEEATGLRDMCGEALRAYTTESEAVTKIGFDIGGVLSKYPGHMRAIVATLLVSPLVEVHVLSDMHPHEKCVSFVHMNGFAIPPEHIHSCDYEAHGDECKAEKAKELGLHVLVDDHMAYVSVTGAPDIRLFVMPDATRDYYDPSWKTDGSEGNFGRRRQRKP